MSRFGRQILKDAVELIATHRDEDSVVPIVGIERFRYVNLSYRTMAADDVLKTQAILADIFEPNPTRERGDRYPAVWPHKACR